jgi:hypothetical protein
MSCRSRDTVGHPQAREQHQEEASLSPSSRPSRDCHLSLSGSGEEERGGKGEAVVEGAITVESPLRGAMWGPFRNLTNLGILVFESSTGTIHLPGYD